MAFLSDGKDDNNTIYAKANAYMKEQEKLRKRERKETVRFWITTIISSIAAIAALAGVLLQLAPKQ